MYFLVKCLFKIFELERFNFVNYFIEVDMQDIEMFWEGEVEDEIKFFYIFKNVVKYLDSNLIFQIIVEEFYCLFENKLFYYNLNV